MNRIYKYCILLLVVVITGQRSYAQQKYASPEDSIAISKVLQIPVVDFLVKDDEYKAAHVRYSYREHTYIRIIARPNDTQLYYCITVSDSGWRRANELYTFVVRPGVWTVRYADPELRKIITLEEWDERNRKKAKTKKD
ncbi:MAG: hypothetical protein K0Q79_2547 [Flavipsychrobacter sp.]|jgi:hypothetical protein|nr:hypothetical protein [Flavipsychrobacter sp.]